VIDMKFGLLWLFILHTLTTATATTAATKVTPQDSLTDFKWRHRLIITHVDSEIKWSKLQDKAQHHSHKFSARKLMWLVVVKNKTWVFNISTFKTASPLLSAEVLTIVEQNLGKVLLIGLDGGIKNRYPIQTFSLEQIFNEIDLMPMRRIESNE
jgi:hypothetical protein